MIEQKINRYKSTGAKNIFKDSRYKDFYIDISGAFFEKGYLDLSHIEFMGQIVAIHFGFNYRNKFFYYMIMRPIHIVIKNYFCTRTSSN